MCVCGCVYTKGEGNKGDRGGEEEILFQLQKDVMYIRQTKIIVQPVSTQEIQ